ncbi:MAG: ATP-binding protein [Nanoarchaeota archaeon]
MDFVETSTVELKEHVTNFNDVAKTACGFANAEGGKIIIGVTNKGLIVGIATKDLDSLQQRIDGAIQTVSPVPFHKIQIEKAESKNVIIVEIYKIGDGTFCTYGEIVYYRFGNTTRKMEGKTLQDFLIHRKILSYDEGRSEATLEDLDDSKLASFLSKRTPGFEYNPKRRLDTLINLSLAKRGGESFIKNTAVLLFAKKPDSFCSQSEIKLARFKGLTAVDIIDSTFAHQSVLENIQIAEDFIRKNTKTRFEIKTIERKEIPDYPSEVVREALVNAVAHRDYFSKDAIQLNIFDDRMEIISPGGLPQGLSLKLLGTLSIQRNALLYRLLRDIKLVEGLATGIPRMRQGMRTHSLPDPIFEDLGSFFKVTLHNTQQIVASALNLRQQKALSYLHKNKSITSQTYSKLTGVSRVTAVSDLQDLIEKRIVQKVGKTRSAYYILSTE